MIYQPSLFAHINSRYHAFKAEGLIESHCETAQFLTRYMYIIQKVLTLIRATRKTSLLFIITPVVEVCSCFMFCCMLLHVPSSFAIILMGKRELVALLSLSSWCLMIVVWLFLAVPWICLQFVIVVFPDHTHLPFLNCMSALSVCFFPNVHCTQSQQLRTICTCVNDYTHKFV